MSGAFLTWVDSGERNAIATAQRVITRPASFALETKSNDINLDDLADMAKKTSKRLQDIRKDQERQCRALDSLKPVELKLHAIKNSNYIESS